MKQDIPSAEIVGLISGKIWSSLHKNGKSSITKLKTGIPCRASFLYFALGWLLREDKIIFIKADGQLFVQLK
ncbi:MAG: hypothetical protein A3I11_07510 [Elusimicrobia bacterium RIFCSPLOWO2_02_FULL_39_32]|nr:MAG: hypothetical protein A2034_00075 [Elusimicrobia bacterium GWA2_38_7]OGR81401.1 MAG: hypothetical protein A3B80_05115 [Elusimicrobia bacterium RIFCSPHIGHO2_02_FULL_39_36]OGR92032.1 MAG: hypothetical protein A3I11_07510 [Elusimicrobia bacterium RIFCSPLOWO2_02_FULL_39_32]OGR98677.1 MAG: hypothetical protein A3G85_04920 [Elusimicrobia bacterium RIFCSPLOWO2_12_FULL_39_28]OGZ59781.1 MAG: hypothetical protein A3E58_00240 [Candidatus Spechtbacteria bacterium RIFCSPHIGHO2_12_FULL_38_30]